MRTITLASLLVLLAFPASPLFGATITYNVNLSGQDPTSGHTLLVTGTITADTTTNTLLDESLTFFHEDEPGVALTFLNPSGEGVGWDWNATPQELRFERISSENGSARWRAAFDPPGQPFVEYWLEFHSGVGDFRDHVMGYVLDDPDGVDLDQVVLKPASGPDSPGFLLGTVVPEPSSILMFALASLLMMNRRRHCPSRNVAFPKRRVLSHV